MSLYRVSSKVQLERVHRGPSGFPWKVPLQSDSIVFRESAKGAFREYFESLFRNWEKRIQKVSLGSI